MADLLDPSVAHACSSGYGNGEEGHLGRSDQCVTCGIRVRNRFSKSAVWWSALQVQEIFAWPHWPSNLYILGSVWGVAQLSGNVTRGSPCWGWLVLCVPDKHTITTTIQVNAGAGSKAVAGEC